MVIYTKEIKLPPLPPYDLTAIKDFAEEDWKIGPTHGASHWQNVERNGVLLCLEDDGEGNYVFRKDINLKVVRAFAYLHDKGRVDDWDDDGHGERSAEIVLSIRDTLLKDFTDEEISLLEKACRLHTVEHKTGNPTIDCCFDADRLDLDRVGILPYGPRMATPQGAHFADYWGDYKKMAEVVQKYLENPSANQTCWQLHYDVRNNILRMKQRTVLTSVISLLAIIIILPIVSYFIVANKTASRIYDCVEDVPYNEVGLLLGTGPTIFTGAPNQFFLFRIDAAEELYKAGKIKFLLVSGDNSRKDYSEPDAMKDSLVNRGIPAEAIFLDYAGFRTLDSVVRAKKVFGQSKMTVISQRFHNERSIILGDWQEMELIGYNAKDTTAKYYRIKQHIREGFARVKLFLDILIDKQPHFLGEPIEIKS